LIAASPLRGSPYYIFKNCLMIVTIAGPKTTIIKAGNMKSTSTGTILMLILAAISSAR
jgi:hypothetical protein